MAATQRHARLCLIACVSTVLLLVLLSRPFRDGLQDQRHARDVQNSTEIPAEHIDPAAIDLTPLVNTLINTSQSGSRQLFSLLSVTSYSSLALHKLTLLVYNISSIKSVEGNRFRRRFCYCVTNETNDLTDFTAVLLDVMGNSSSYLHELFKSASILSVSQRNNSDCIYICVMAGKMGREASELWEVESIRPLFNQTIIEGPHRVGNVSSIRLPPEWQQPAANLSHASPSGMSSVLTSRVHSTAHVSPTAVDETAAETANGRTSQPPATARRPATATPTEGPTTAGRPDTTQEVTTRAATPRTTEKTTQPAAALRVTAAASVTSQPTAAASVTSQPTAAASVTSQPAAVSVTSQPTAAASVTSQPTAAASVTSQLTTAVSVTSQLTTAASVTSQPAAVSVTSQPAAASTRHAAISPTRRTTASQHAASTDPPSGLPPARLTLAGRTTGPQGRRTTTPSKPVEKPERAEQEAEVVTMETQEFLRSCEGCPWRRPELPRLSGGVTTTTVGAHKLQPCVLELCKFFSQCVCRPAGRRTRMKRSCEDSQVWYEEHTSEVCRRVRRLSFSRSLKQRCLSKMCSKV